MLPTFQALREHFPALSLVEVKQLIGGRVNADWITNACAIRLSRAFNYCDALHRLPGPSNAYGLSVVSGDDGLWYAYRVTELAAYLRARYGAPTVTLTGTSDEMRNGLTNQRGVIRFDVAGWSDATGHLDLWDGTTCSHHCYFDPGPGVTTKRVELWTA